MDLAARLRDLREEAGLSKTALARPRYTVSYVSQIEAGRRKPSQVALEYFAGRLGTSASFLSTGVPEGLEESLRYQLEEARMAMRAGDAGEGLRVVEPVLSQADQYGMARLHAEALLVRGDALALDGRVREAVDDYEAALEGDLPEAELGRAVTATARAYRSLGDLSYAADSIESFLSRGDRPAMDPAVLADLHAILVSIYFERGDVLRAERTARRALAAADREAPLEIRANAYWSASRVLAEARRWDEALDFATRARLLLEQVDDRRGVARLHNAYAFICLEAEPPRVEEAAFHLDRAEELLGQVGGAGDRAYVLTERSRLALLTGRADEALAHADASLSEAGGDPLERARGLFLRGRALAQLDRREEARGALRDAATLFGDRGARQQEAACWRELGELDLAEGNPAGAVEALRAGLAALDPRRSRA
ncbi:MAG: helix-turn-helix transcriptional regulator [Actinobacteria bacterium]|nr:helix-turn-helix transcriptional regulator [Actinomycetota bacterium]